MEIVKQAETFYSIYKHYLIKMQKLQQVTELKNMKQSRKAVIFINRSFPNLSVTTLHKKTF